MAVNRNNADLFEYRNITNKQPNSYRLLQAKVLSNFIEGKIYWQLIKMNR